VRGQVVVRVSPPAPSVHVSRVSVSHYQVEVELLEVNTRVHRMHLRPRGGRGDVTMEYQRDRNGIKLRLPLEELTRSTSAIRPGRTIWEIEASTSDGRMSLESSMGDIKNPRDAVHYRAIRLAKTPGMDRFRPYWTLDGRLVLQHDAGSAELTAIE